MHKIAKYLIIVLLSFGERSFSQIPKLSDYRLQIEKKSKMTDGDKAFFLIHVTLFNQSKDTLRYHSESCSWQDYYSINNSKLKITPSVCDKNIPIVLTLAPQQTRQVVLKIETQNDQDLNNLAFRIGFHLLVDRVYIDNYEVSEEFQKNILWSNEIALLRD